MKCPFCGRHSEPDLCPFCGMQKSLAETIRHTADRFYRKGFQAAGIGDFYGAAGQLEQALFYDGENVRALNLLGLVRYQVGDVAEAAMLWEKSVKVDAREDNRANRYLHEIHRHEGRFETLLEAVRLYNDAILQCESGSLDYAVARLRKAISLNRGFVKGELLLVLVLIEQKQFKKAVNLLRRVERQDPLHPLIARYRRIIADLTEIEGEEDAAQTDIQDISEEYKDRNTLTESEIQEIFGSGKRRKKNFTLRSVLMQTGMFFFGVLCSLAFAYTLLFPDQVDTLRDQVSTMNAALSVAQSEQEKLRRELSGAQQAEYEAQQQKTELENRIEALEDELHSGEKAVEGNLSTAASAYLNGQYKECALAMLNVDPEALNKDDQSLYESLRESIAYQVEETIYPEGYTAYIDAQEMSGEERMSTFETAVEDLLIAENFLEEDTSRWYYAMYYLGRTYYFMERYAQAEQQLQKFMEEYNNYDDLYETAEEMYYDAQAKAG